MKRKFLILLVLFNFLLTTIISALSKYYIERKDINNTYNRISEDFEINYSGRCLDSITVTYIIEENFEDDEIIITPNIFEKLEKYTMVVPGDEIGINIKVINNSKYDYMFKDNLFILSTNVFKFKESNIYGFDGNKYNVKEKNDEIVELSYNWFYNKLFSITFKDYIYDYKTSEIYCIDSYMRNKLVNNEFKTVFDELNKNNSKEITDIKININGPYTVNTYQIYPFGAYMEFRFKKIKNSVKEQKEEPKNILEEAKSTDGNVDKNYQNK